MRRPTYANVTATIALVVALSAGAYAAGLGRNDVKSKNIAPKAVKSGDIASKAVKTKKLGNDAATGAKVAEATLGLVPDADRLDGLDSTALLRGSGRVRAVQGTDEFSGDVSAPIPLDIGGTITAECRSPASAGSDLIFTNTSQGALDVWTDRFQNFGTTMSLGFASVPPGGEASLSVSGPPVGTGTAIARFTISSGSAVTLVEARIVATTATSCRFPLLISEVGG
jgi:hypothetical protein